MGSAVVTAASAQGSLGGPEALNSGDELQTKATCATILQSSTLHEMVVTFLPMDCPEVLVLGDHLEHRIVSSLTLQSKP